MSKSTRSKTLIRIAPHIIYADKRKHLTSEEYARYVDLVSKEDFVYFSTPKYKVFERYKLEKRATLQQIINAFVRVGLYDKINIRNEVFNYYQMKENLKNLGI